MSPRTRPAYAAAARAGRPAAQRACLAAYLLCPAPAYGRAFPQGTRGGGEHTLHRVHVCRYAAGSAADRAHPGFPLRV